MERRGEDHLAGSDSQSNSDLQFKIATPSLASSMNVKVSLPVRGREEKGVFIFRIRNWRPYIVCFLTSIQ
jgi:hypothetical protein